MPCKLTFRGDSKLVTKISTLLRPAKADCKKPTEIKCKAESILTALDKNPCKKLKTDDSEPVSSLVISVDDNTLHTVSPKVWIAFKCKVLTEADKDIVMLGEKLTDKHTYKLYSSTYPDFIPH